MSASIALINPKFPHNVGGAIRAMSCFGEGHVLYTGDRFDLNKGRLPREERMKAYGDIKWGKVEKPTLILPDLIPVGVELVPGAEKLHQFEHPENALYIFGPEDGSLPKGIRAACHRFIVIPTKHCTNLAAAVYITLYDRALKRWMAGLEDMPELSEERGWCADGIEVFDGI